VAFFQVQFYIKHLRQKSPLATPIARGLFFYFALVMGNLLLVAALKKADRVLVKVYRNHFPVEDD
jgi:lipid-A-disaccharide synthase-like uncharacterized protein